MHHLQDSALKIVGQLLQRDNPLCHPHPCLLRDRHTAESRAGVDAFRSNDLKSSSVLVNYLGKLSPKSLYSLLLLVPAGPQTRAEGVFVHRKNFSIFLWFPSLLLDIWGQSGRKDKRPSARRVLAPGVGFGRWLLLATSL